MTEFMEYVASRKPRSFWCEEVDRFIRQDPRTGESYVKSFMRKGKALGYAMRALILDHNVWIELPRRRIYVIGVGPEMGHSAGADFIISQMKEIQEYRMLTPPTAAFDLWDPDCPAERDRLGASEELAQGLACQPLPASQLCGLQCSHPTHTANRALPTPPAI